MNIYVFKWLPAIRIPNKCLIFPSTGNDRHHRDGLQGSQKGPRSRHLAERLLDQIPILRKKSACVGSAFLLFLFRCLLFVAK